VQHGPCCGEGDIDGKEVEGASRLLEREELEVGALDEGDARVGAERVAHLVAAHIDAGDVGCTGTEHGGREAAMGASDIQRPATTEGGAKPEVLERRLEFEPTSGYEGCGIRRLLAHREMSEPAFAVW